MFEYLAPFSRIIVTGPQRSGTTICAAMIAHDLGYRLCLEDKIATDSYTQAALLIAASRNFVLQAPALCHYAERLSIPQMAIVLMRRGIEDIVASEHRIGWHGSAHHKWELQKYGVEDGVISEIKYAYWEIYQQSRIHNPFEVEYESLAAHPMWIPKEERVNFRSRQYQRVP